MVQWFRRYLNKSVSVFRVPALRSAWRIWVALAVLVMATLACNLVKVDSQPTPQRIVQYKLLPPATPTIIPSESTNSQNQSVEVSPGTGGGTPVAVVPSVDTNIANTSEPVVGDVSSNESPPQDTPTFTPVPVQPTLEPTTIPPTSTSVPTPTETPTTEPTFTPPPPSEWSFSNVRLDTEQYEGDLLLYGNVINNSDTAKMLAYITGIFYDDQNQVIADEGDTYDYWLVDVIPPQAQLPFELTVANVQNVANFDFIVEAESGGESKSSAFEFVDVQVENDGDYCLVGTLKNVGRELNDYVTVIGVLYDEQESMINFSYDEFSVESFNNGDSEEFYVCVDTLGHQVARYDLQAWGE